MQNRRVGQSIRLWLMGAAVAGCLLAGCFFRYVAAGDLLWLDEQHTAWTVSCSLKEVFGRAADGNQLPAYFWLNWCLVQCISWLDWPLAAEFALRLLSLACSFVMAVSAVAWLHWRTNCGLAVLVFSVFWMVDGPSIYYASEARPYSLVMLIGIWQAFAFWRWCECLLLTREPRRQTVLWAIGTGGLSVLLFYTHCTSMLLIVGQVSFGLMLMLVKRRIPWRYWLAMGVGGAVLCLPGVFQLASVWQRRGNWQSVSDPNGMLQAVVWQAGWMIGLPLAGLLMGHVVDNKRIRKGAVTEDQPIGEHKSSSPAASSWLLFFLAVWAVVPSVLCWAFDHSEIAALALPRYAIVGTVAFPLFAAVAIASCRVKLFRWLGAAVVIGSLLASQAADLKNQLTYGWRYENWVRVIRLLNREQDDDPIFLAANVIEDRDAMSNTEQRFQAYLKFPLQGIPRVHPARTIIPVSTHDRLFHVSQIKKMTECGGGWLVMRIQPHQQQAIVDEISQSFRVNLPKADVHVFVPRFSSRQYSDVQLFRIAIADGFIEGGFKEGTGG